MKTQADTDRIKLSAKIKYRDALVRFQTKHLDFRLLAAEAIDGDNTADAETVQPEPQAQKEAEVEAVNRDTFDAAEATTAGQGPTYNNVS